MKTNKFQLYFKIAIAALFVFNINIVKLSAEKTVIRQEINKQTAVNGITVKSVNKKFKVGVTPNSLKIDKKGKLTIKELNKEDFNLEDEQLISKLYSYNFINGAEVNGDKEIWLSIRYKNKNKIMGTKIIKFWNGDKEKWQKIPSKKIKKKNLVQGAIHLNYAVVGVFNKKTKTKKTKKKETEVVGDYQIGIASWYDYHGAASTKYPYGSIVKVTNLNNGKSCEVTIVDYGPFVEGRVIDLPRESFAEIADIGAGVVKVKVEPIYIP